MCFFLVLDEPTDIPDTAQLMLFILRVNDEFEVTEKLTVINSPQVRIFSKNLRKLIQYNLRWDLLKCVITDSSKSIHGAVKAYS